MSEQLDVGDIKQIGPYKMHGVVGDGAFSVVKLAKDVNTGKYFACKIVPRSRLNTKHLEERFEIEIRIFQQMHHPGIVQLYDLLKDELNYYILMEFCPNGELFQFIVDRGCLTEDVAKPLLRQVLEALDYIHQMGISHRDLKPENLLIDSLGHIKLSDFGLSKHLNEDGLVDTPCGSPCYASPECISGHAYDGITTDVWSAGVILYAMLTGQLPWTKRNQAQLFKQIKSGDYQIPDGLSDEAADLISRMMEVDYRRRITIPEIFEHPWMDSVGPQFVESESSICYRVSLRAVDNFFSTDDNDAYVNPRDVLTKSCPQFSFQDINRQFASAGGLPKLHKRSKDRPSASSTRKSGHRSTREKEKAPAEKDKEKEKTKKKSSKSGSTKKTEGSILTSIKKRLSVKK